MTPTPPPADKSKINAPVGASMVWRSPPVMLPPLAGPTLSPHPAQGHIPGAAHLDEVRCHRVAGGHGLADTVGVTVRLAIEVRIAVPGDGDPPLAGPIRRECERGILELRGAAVRVVAVLEPP